MRIGDTITLTKDQFLKLAPLGLQVFRNSTPRTIFAYLPEVLPRYHSQGYYHHYIKGYIYSRPYDHPSVYYPINGLWSYFDGVTKFTVVQPPRFKILKTKVL